MDGIIENKLADLWLKNLSGEGFIEAAAKYH